MALVVLVFERTPDVFLLALQRSQSPAFVQARAGHGEQPGAARAGAPDRRDVSVRDGRVREHGVERAGADAGRLYAINTIGAIGGTVLAGFVLVPAIGVHASIVAGIATNLLLAAVLFVAARCAASRGGDGPAASGCLAAAARGLLPAAVERGGDVERRGDLRHAVPAIGP